MDRLLRLWLRLFYAGTKRDAAPLFNKIVARSGDVVLFPGGSYTLKTAVRIHAGMTVTMPKTRITAIGGAAGLRYHADGSLTINGN